MEDGESVLGSKHFCSHRLEYRGFCFTKSLLPLVVVVVLLVRESRVDSLGVAEVDRLDRAEPGDDGPPGLRRLPGARARECRGEERDDDFICVVQRWSFRM